MRVVRTLAVALVALSVAACGSAARPTASPLVGATRSASGAPTASPPPVPAEYAAMYKNLQTQLDAWDRAIPSTPVGTAPIFGGHVLAANGNRGPELLAPETLPTVDLELDALKRLGSRGVTVTISFPLLNASYPRASDYVAFYETVAKHARDRGLAFTVEQHVAFVGTSFSAIQFDFRSTSFDQFVALDRDMTRTVLERVQPDYLTLLSEPDTFAKITGYRDVSTPLGAATMVQRVISGLERGRTKIGAGAGSWLEDAPQYDAAFARIGVDYVDLHVYPLTAGTIKTTQAIVDAAKTAGKPIVLDEAWLYKIGANDPPQPSLEQTTEIFRRDPFSFWEPLDARFLGLVARLARSGNVAYVAPFWTTYFFGDVTYGAATKDLPYQQVTQQANMAAAKAMRQGNVTATGIAYAQAIAGR